MSLSPPENHSRLTIYALSKLGQGAARAVETALAPLDLRPREFSALALIDELGGSAQSDVADRLGIDRSDMVAVVDKLETKGLVSRRQDPKDRRRHVVDTTRSGAALVPRGAKALAAADSAFMADLTKSDQRQLSELLAALGKSVDC